MSLAKRSAGGQHDRGIDGPPGEKEGAARRLLVFGLAAPPAVVCNGKELKGPFPRVQVGGRDAIQVPLADAGQGAGPVK